jgi:hypothetical protein
VLDVKIGLENFSGTRIQRLLEARKYQRISKSTYKIVKVTFTIMKSGLPPDLFVRCRMHLREPLMISYRTILRMISLQLEVDWGVTVTQVGLPFSPFNLGCLTVSRFHSIHAAKPIVYDIHASRCIYQRPGSSGYDHLPCRKYWR